MANFRADPIDTETINSISGSNTDLVFNARALKVDRYGAALNLSGSVDSSNVAATASGRGQIWVSGSSPTTLVFRDDNGEDKVLTAGLPLDRHLINIPTAPSGTVEFRGWASYGCKLVKAKAYNVVTNTVGTYTLTLTNNATSNTMLNAANFNMNTLVADTVTNLSLTSTAADLNFSENDRWTISLASNNSGLNAVSVYVDLTFQVTASL